MMSIVAGVVLYLSVGVCCAQNAKPSLTAPQSTQDPTQINLDAYPEVRAYLMQDQPGSALAALKLLESTHENDPTYYNLAGILALKAGKYQAAVSSLERVVLMQPENAGAWLDLAIANVESGNLATAASYFDYVEAEFHPPPALQEIIARYRERGDRIAGASQPRSLWHTTIDMSAGVDTNANSGLQVSAIPLTFGAERADLVLDPAFKAQSDHFAQFGVGTHYLQQAGSRKWELMFSAKRRAYQTQHAFSTLDLTGSAGVHQATVMGDASAWLHLEHLSLGGKPLLRNMRAAVQLEHPIALCRLGVSIESEWRRYIDLSALDANVLWGQTGIACDTVIHRVPLQTIFIGRMGIDNPLNNRAGGQTRRNELIGQLTVPLAWGARAELSATFASGVDAEGYSPLLEQNAVRWLNRRNLRFQLTAPLSNKTDFVLDVDDNRYTSNLPLFVQSGRSLSVGIRRQF